MLLQSRIVKFVSVAALCAVMAFTGMVRAGEKEPIKIGALFSVTGGASFLGDPEKKTAEMLVEKLNADGGILGHKVELIVKDTQGASEKALSFAKQFIEKDKVLAIIGPSTSGETLAIKKLCEKNRMILVSCAAAELIVDPVAKYVFKTPQKDSFAVEKIYGAMKDMGVEKIAVVAGSSGFGKAGKMQLEAIAKKKKDEYGLDIAIAEVYSAGATDLTAVVTKVKAKKPDAVVNWSITPAQSIIAKNMKQVGLDVPLFQSHGFGNIKYVEAAGEAAEGVIFPCGRLLVAGELPEDHPQKKLLMEYKTSYEKKYDEQASTFGGHAYDAITLLKAAIEKAGSVESEKVRDALENVQGVMGTAGEFNMTPKDHNGLDMTSFEMLTVKDGAFAIYEAGKK